jgi:phosphoenolpyruvate carboxykinase (GTP)
MAMLPFCGYHMADYWGHWLRLGTREGARLPKVFNVNWFRKGADGRFLWPGYGENSRVLAWIFRRCEGTADAHETAIGLLPPLGDGGIGTSGLEISDEAMAELVAVDVEGWKRQLPLMHEHYAQFSSKLPAALRGELAVLEARLRG